MSIQFLPPDTPALDGNLDFSGGQDASKIADRIAPNAYHAGVNLTTRLGALGPRPGFNKLPLVLPEGEIFDVNGAPHSYATIFNAGRYQAIAPYSIGNDYYLVIVISGIIFLVNQVTYEVQVMPINDGSYIDENHARVNWSPAGRFLVLFDFPNFPVILDGLICRRANPANMEVPISVMGTYNQNRLFVSNAGNEFTGGDPSGYTFPDAPITFQEILTPAAPFFGQIFQLPTNYNNDVITGMGFLQFVDNSTGIGPLLVSTPNAVYSYQTQNPRDTWEQGTFGSLFIHGTGFAGPRSFTNVNSDLFFLSSDGQIRSASMSREEQKKWSRVPLSREVENWLKYWDRSLIPYGVVGYFHNKIMISVNPYRVPSVNNLGIFSTDVTHGGLVVIELDNISTLTTDSKPAWAGLWTGVRPMDILVNNGRCFIVSKDSSYINEIWEMDSNLTSDTANGKERYIKSIFYSRNYDFQNPFQNKAPTYLDIPVKNVQGDLDLDVYYKPSHAPCFLHWRKFTHKAPYRMCGIPQGCETNGLAPHNFREVSFGTPEEKGCDPITQILYEVFRQIQLKFIIKAKNWLIPEFLIRAATLPQNFTEVVCKEYPVVAICEPCDSDWYVEDFESCQPSPLT